jgi:predicted HicB family RNase H-like nuclease
MKAIRNDHYTYRVTWSEDDQEYVGLCAEFPSVVAEVVADMKKNREPIPDPLASRKFSGKFMVRIPPDVHRELTVEAAEAGVSLNRLASAKLSR